MRAAVRRMTVFIYLVTACASYAQQQPSRTPTEGVPPPSDLGPATTPTADRAADSVKTPIGIPAMPTAAPVDPKTFVIGPEDILAVKVWRENDLTGAVQVRPDGKITLPLVGEVVAAGQTPEQLKSTIIEKLSDYINKPEVMVSVQSVQSRRYYITGEINRPGAFQLVVPTTVLQALTNAGGFREFANKKKIKILRHGQLIKFNYSEVIKAKNLQQNIFVENGDYIIVP